MVRHDPATGAYSRRQVLVLDGGTKNNAQIAILDSSRTKWAVTGRRGVRFSDATDVRPAGLGRREVGDRHRLKAEEPGGQLGIQ